jgi:hypothetical protein
MPYAPTVNDRSGEILAEFQTNAANIRAQGMANMGQSIGEGLSAMGSGIAGGMEKVQANTAKANTNLGTAEALDQIYGTYGTPEQRQNFLTGLDKVSGNQDKTAGYLAMHQQTGQSLIELNKSKQIADIYGANNKDLAMWKAGNTGAAVADPKYDANRARESYELIRNRGYNHDQAIEAMNASGMNWGVQYITPPARGLSIMDEVLPRPTSPPPTR